MEDAKHRALEQYQVFSQRQIKENDDLAEREFEQEVERLLPPSKKGS